LHKPLQIIHNNERFLIACLGNLEIIGCLGNLEKLLVALETWKNYWLPWKPGKIIGCLAFEIEKLLVALPLKLKNYWLP
jgi:hypothetical protein